jgi:hypothetical protein
MRMSIGPIRSGQMILYQIMFSIEDGEVDTATLLIDSLELTDVTQDCIPAVGQMAADINRDCNVDLLDFAQIAKGRLNGI